MPINLSEYTPRIRDSLKRGGFACVYVASTPEGKPTRVGHTVNLHSAIAEVQHHCPSPVWVQEVIWLPDRGIASRIAKVTQAQLANKILHGGWFDEDADKVVDELNFVIFRTYPNATMVTHSQLIAEYGRKPQREAAE